MGKNSKKDNTNIQKSVEIIKMNILFIYPIAPQNICEIGFQQGIGSISSVLKQNGHNTILVYLPYLNKKEIKEKIDLFKPNIIGISSTTDYIPIVKEFANFVSKEFKLPIILGGIHATVNPEDAINIPGLFGICRGEGEYAFLELVNALEKNEKYEHIKNFWFKKSDKIIRNDSRDLIKNLDELPFPDRELFDFKFLLKQRRDAEFMGSRGCPFDCTYCVNHTLNKLYRNKGVILRYRTVDNFLREIKQVTSKYKVKLVGLHDDTFTLNKNWLKEFCEKYPKMIRLPFWCNARADTISEDIVRMLKNAGCIEIRIAIEVGNNELRQKILKKNISTEQIIKAFAILKKFGIQAFTFNMIGLPYETEKNILETIELNKKVKPDTIQVSIFRPYPNTHLYNTCKKEGWISDRQITTFFGKTSVLNHPNISQEKLAYYLTTFVWKIKHPFFSIFFDALYKIRIKKTNLFEIALNLRNKIIRWAGSSLTEKQREFIKKMLTKLNLYSLLGD